ncbi:MAG: hypothetical protein WBA28_09365, partial [Microbacteriaceae bacterium]
MKNIPDHWQQLVITVAKTMILVGTIPAMVFIGAFGTQNPWVSFFMVILLALCIFSALTSLSNPQS